MPRNGGRVGPTAIPDSGGVWPLSEAYQKNRDGLWKLIPGLSEVSPLTSPTEAELYSLPAGDYYFRSASMSQTLLLRYEPGYEDGSSFVRVFRSPYGSAAIVNHLDKAIPFTKILIQRDTRDLKGLVRFYSAQSYVTTGNPGINGVSGTNNFGATPVLRIYLGLAGGHGIYNTAQSTCSWSGTIAGAIGAGWDGSTCGSFPNDLRWGNGPSNNGPAYSNRSGTWEHWITW